MRQFFYAMIASLILPTSVALAEYKAGDAVEFSTKDIYGTAISTESLKGKTVVMEWTNAGCPFVVKHYESGNMQQLQKELGGKDEVVWISVNSSAKGKQGYVTAEEAKAQLKEQGAMPDHMVLDADGALGRLFGAKTTPHMYVIDQQGKVAYAGAIDDDRSADPAKAKGAKNYVKEAVINLLEGGEVTMASTAPYGCSVKYKN
jgi:peroxiredoxin